MSEHNLIDCPWCDPLKMTLIGRPKMMGFGHVSDGITHWHGFCVACGAEGPKEATRDAAAGAWNRRGALPDDVLLQSARRLVANTKDIARRTSGVIPAVRQPWLAALQDLEAVIAAFSAVNAPAVRSEAEPAPKSPPPPEI